MTDLSDRIVDHYEKHALAWDADRRGAVWSDEPWHGRFLAALPAGARVLDLGCGGGAPVACHLAACGARITGVDASPTLISLCHERLPDQEWIVADMRSLALGRRFDGVLAWDSFFHLTPEAQRSMFSVFARHSAPGTLLMFNAGPAHGVRIGSYRGDPLYHASLDPAEYDALLGHVDFATIAHTTEDRGIGGRTAWLARRRGPITAGTATARGTPGCPDSRPVC